MNSRQCDTVISSPVLSKVEGAVGNLFVVLGIQMFDVRKWISEYM